ncbi:MAG: S-layer homology domain-containing protein [Oscillospiraceae bacterium]|nr:S-layer homology domain-containing protein [Oscillospiraceae bacterium]
MIDPATYSSDTQWSFNSYSGDPAYEETLLRTTKFYFGAILDFTSKELAKMGYTLADLGFVQYTDNEAHNWYSIRYWGPSCFQNGFRECICQYCEEERSETIPAYGSHLWDEGSILEEVSCTSEGKILKKCTRCGESKTEVIPALGHAWTLTEILTEPGEGGQHACTGLYSCSRCGETKEAILCAAEVFTDMPSESHWAHKAIDWAWYHGITGGTSPNRFSPNAAINRAQAVTFLWAAAGKPAPESSANPFTDVSADAYYRKAVLWAVEQNITAGSSADSFSPRQTVTRAQTVTFLWAAAGRPEPKSTECPFTDVGASSWYRKAVIWAYENQITGGTGGGCFSPRQNCTRAQVLTFLYKAAPFSTPTPIVESEIEN